MAPAPADVSASSPARPDARNFPEPEVFPKGEKCAAIG